VVLAVGIGLFFCSEGLAEDRDTSKIAFPDYTGYRRRSWRFVRGYLLITKSVPRAVRAHPAYHAVSLESCNSAKHANSDCALRRSGTRELELAQSGEDPLRVGSPEIAGAFAGTNTSSGRALRHALRRMRVLDCHR